MNGQKESIKDQFDNIERALDEFEQSLHLPAPSAPLDSTALSKILNMTRDNLEHMSIDDCAYTAYTLQCYILFMQRIINKERGRLIWGEMVLKKMIAPEVANFRGSWDYQEQQAINYNSTAERLQQSLILIKSKIARLSNVTNTIENMAKQLQNIQYIKKGHNNE